MENSMLKQKIYKNLVTMLCVVCLLCGCQDNMIDSGAVTQESANSALTEKKSKRQKQFSTKQKEKIKKEINGKTIQGKESTSKMKVHFIDVGQGSATLVESNGKFLLMDGGDSSYSSKVVGYLKKRGVKTLDYVIVTHYDADHINGVIGAIHAYRVKKVIAPNYKPSTKVYQSFAAAVKQKKLQITYPIAGKSYKIGKAKFTILAPNDSKYSEANDYSTCIKLVNGKNRFIITGDAETESEYEMIQKGYDLRTDVYVAGHHGSHFSSSQAFLDAMKPKEVIISAGANNKYGHPAEETMARLKARKCKIYRTDESGDIVATSTGKKITFSVKPSKGYAYRKFGDSAPKENLSEKGTYIGNRNSMVYHKKNCSCLPDEQNRVYFDSKKEAEKQGYKPCGRCKP